MNAGSGFDTLIDLLEIDFSIPITVNVIETLSSFLKLLENVI